MAAALPSVAMSSQTLGNTLSRCSGLVLDDTWPQLAFVCAATHNLKPHSENQVKGRHSTSLCVRHRDPATQGLMPWQAHDFYAILVNMSDATPDMQVEVAKLMFDNSA